MADETESDLKKLVRQTQEARVADLSELIYQFHKAILDWNDRMRKYSAARGNND